MSIRWNVELFCTFAFFVAFSVVAIRLVIRRRWLLGGMFGAGALIAALGVAASQIVEIDVISKFSSGGGD